MIFEFPKYENASDLTTPAIIIGIAISFFYIVRAVFAIDLNDPVVP
jgi:hypothetical protein